MVERAAALVISAVMVFTLLAPAYAAPRFPDIAGHWCEKEVGQASDLGFIDGYPDGTMRPDNTVTRAEFLKMVVAANKFRLGDTRDPNIPFDDVLGHWCLPYLGTGVGKGIVVPTEYPDRKYRPDGPITRDEAAAYVIRSLGLSDVARAKDPNTAPFRDMGTVKGYYLGDVTLCAEIGVLKGYEDGTVRGDRTLTRAEAVVMVLRALSWKGTRPQVSIPLEDYRKVRYAVSGTIQSSVNGGPVTTTPVDQEAIWYYAGTFIKAKSGSYAYESNEDWQLAKDTTTSGLLEPLYSFSSDTAGIIPLIANPPLFGDISENLFERPLDEHEYGKMENGVELDGPVTGTIKGPYWQIEGDQYRLCREVKGTWQCNLSNGEKASGDFSIVAYYDPVKGHVVSADMLYHGAFERTKTSVSAQIHMVQTQFNESNEFEVNPF